MSRPFIYPDFLLENQTARWLYHEVAAHQPIIDYHCHLPPVDLASDRRFANLYEIWLEGDHYKWRAMRANGIGEKYITGDADPYEKFLAWARTAPMTLRNPLYHWNHLELARHFEIFDLLDESSAESIWQRANAKLAEPGFSVHGILKQMRVEVICTTDDPLDSLEHHQALRKSGLATKVYPAFRPDRAMAIADSAAWNQWVDTLGSKEGTTISTFEDFLSALRARHDFFHEQGGRLSDHGLNFCPAAPASDAQLADIFRKARAGGELLPLESEQFAARVLLEVARWNHERGWTFQLHLGALRNNNSRMLRQVGRDSGFDSLGDFSQGERLKWVLDSLDSDDRLPRTILYNLNPSDNYLFASMAGNFNDGIIPGKVQFGSGWWFLDQREGMEWQINALSNIGLLSRFVGMLTDSRSFLSYPRHEYFRRILCNLFGREVETGILPDNRRLLTEYIERICYKNAAEYFQFAD